MEGEPLMKLALVMCTVFVPGFCVTHTPAFDTNIDIIATNIAVVDWIAHFLRLKHHVALDYFRYVSNTTFSAGKICYYRRVCSIAIGRLLWTIICSWRFNVHSIGCFHVEEQSKPPRPTSNIIWQWCVVRRNAIYVWMSEIRNNQILCMNTILHNQLLNSVI